MTQSIHIARIKTYFHLILKHSTYGLRIHHFNFNYFNSYFVLYLENKIYVYHGLYRSIHLPHSHRHSDTISMFTISFIIYNLLYFFRQENIYYILRNQFQQLNCFEYIKKWITYNIILLDIFKTAQFPVYISTQIQFLNVIQLNKNLIKSL